MKNKILALFTFAILTIALIPLSGLSGTPPELKNAQIWLDNFMGNGKTLLVADVISFKHDSLKFKLGNSVYDYSGHYSFRLITPRKHANPYFGFGSPETAKILILEDFMKGESDGTTPLPNATIWEKSDGFIVAVALNSEWIHSGNYSIRN